MFSKLTKYLYLMVLILGSSTTSAETLDCTPIDTLPYSITKQGIYCLTKDLTTSAIAGAAISINTNNVTIDLNGWKIGGKAGGKASLTVGIYAYQKRNITLRNGTIRGFYRGIQLDDLSALSGNSSGHLIEDIRADGNNFIGIQVWGVGNIVRRNQVVNTGGSTIIAEAWGIWFAGHGGRLLDNDIINTRAPLGGDEAYGIICKEADGAVVESNRIHNVKGYSGYKGVGIRFDQTQDALVVGNRITSATTGIWFNPLPPASNGKFMDNLTRNVGTPFNGGNAIGIND